MQLCHSFEMGIDIIRVEKNECIATFMRIKEQILI